MQPFTKCGAPPSFKCGALSDTLSEVLVRSGGRLATRALPAIYRSGCRPFSPKNDRFRHICARFRGVGGVRVRLTPFSLVPEGLLVRQERPLCHSG